MALPRWPLPYKAPICDQWRELQRLSALGLASAIGVSNFSVKKLAALLSDGEQTCPAVNQVESGAHLRQEVQPWCAPAPMIIRD